MQIIVCLDPKVLAIPSALTSLLLPSAFGYTPGEAPIAQFPSPVVLHLTDYFCLLLHWSDIGGSADLMATRSGSGTFDELEALEVGANLAISAIFSAPRLERLAVQAQRNSSLPSLAQVFARLTNAVFAVNITADVASGECSTLQGGQVLALTAVQSVLANAYMSVVDTSSTGHSLLVRNFCKYHVQNVLLPAIAAQTSALTAMSQDNPQCAESIVLLLAHSTGLTSAVNAGKVFMTVATPPLGPPI